MDFLISEYTDFINAIINIGNRFSTEVFSEKRLWGLITDFYQFPNQTALRDMTKFCIDNGYVKVLLLEGKKNFLAVIKNLIQDSGSTSESQKKDIAAILFAVAVAVDYLTLEDWDKIQNIFQKQPTKQLSSPKPQHTPTPPPPASSSKSRFPSTAPVRNPSPSPIYTPYSFPSSGKLSKGDMAWIAVGILLLVGSTAFYRFTISDGEPLWVVIPTFIIFQAGWWSITSKMTFDFHLNLIHDFRVYNLISAAFPIMVGFFLNGIIALLLCIPTIYRKLSASSILISLPSRILIRPWMNYWPPIRAVLMRSLPSFSSLSYMR